MDKDMRRRSPTGVTITGTLALLLVLCLVECATEQRIISRGSQSTNIIDKVNGWRSQRGGSCLSYGHSCWGAHGKRSGKPAAAPDWLLSKLLRNMESNADLNHGPRPRTAAIYQMEAADDSSSDRMGSDNVSRQGRKEPLGKPMLDDDMLSNIKLWKIMREAPVDE